MINYQFKILYAIGIYLVVANHCGGHGGISVFYEFFPAYAFHIGLFIFCSGYFYKEKSEQNIGKYILKKLKKLVVPMYMANFVYALLMQLLSLKGFSIGAGVTWKKLLIEPITSGHQFGFNLATWFVVPLFMAEVFNVLYRKILSIRESKNMFILLGLWHWGCMALYCRFSGDSFLASRCSCT